MSFLRFQKWCGFASAMILASCGGTLGDGTGIQTTGTLVDYTIAGVTYQTPSQNGVTNASGEFGYKTGETITFKIGDTVLGSLKAKTQITALDLAGLSSLPADNQTFDRDIDSTVETPLRRLLAILVVLETLDFDGNSSNGIEIRPEIAALFTGVSMSMGESGSGMVTNFALLKAVNQANTSALFSQRATKAATIALQNYYLVRDVDYQIFAPTNFTYEDTGDTQLDKTGLYQYDERGSLLYSEERLIPDTGVTRTYFDTCNSKNQNTGHESDNPANGPIESVLTLVYYTFGGLHFIRNDYGGNGSIDYQDTYTYNFLTNTRREESDFTNDGMTDKVSEKTFDANGREVLSRTDNDNDGDWDSVGTNSYDSEGKLIQAASDTDGDGPLVATVGTYFYQNGRVVKIWLDLGNDQVIEQEEVFTYHASGGVLRHAYRDEVNGVDVAWQDRTFNSNGDILTDISCLLLGEAPLCYNDTLYTYDSKRNLVSTKIDYEAEGDYDAETRHAYDSQNRKFKTEIDSDLDGDAESTTNVTNFSTTGLVYVLGCI